MRDPRRTTSPTRLSPSAIKSAYNFPTSSTVGIGKTIAIVDAYNDPNIEADLGVFDTQYGLPACTTANGCCKKVNQTGGTSASSPMWAARSADAGVVVNAAYVYGSSITYRDITSGNNGASCLVSFDLCSGRSSWTGTTS